MSMKKQISVTNGPKRCWQFQLFDQQGQPRMTKRLWAEELTIGASPDCNIRVPVPMGQIVGKIRLHVEGYEWIPLVMPLEDEEALEGIFSDRSIFQSLPRIPVGEFELQLSEITDQRLQKSVAPEEWAEGIDNPSQTHLALWHIYQGQILASYQVAKNQDQVALHGGLELDWRGLTQPSQVRDSLGQNYTVELGEGRLGFPRFELGDHVFVVTVTRDKNYFDFVPQTLETQNDNQMFRRVLASFVVTWLILMGVFQGTTTGQVPEIAVEELPAQQQKLVVERKQGAGGNGKAGGGGNPEVTTNDPRGGSGFEAAMVAEAASTRDEVQFQQNSAAGAIQKVEKVLGTGLGKILDAGSKLSSALGKLDEGVASGKYAAAGMVGARGPAGIGSVSGALGAIGQLGGSGNGAKGGGGVGIGGVGTKGFGGGGGGGRGGGFGTGIGDGLGAGNGPRNIAFADGDADVMGGLEKSEVEAVIAENINQIRFCYNQGLRTNPSMQGKVVSQFTISAQGRVSESRVAQSTLASSDVESCMSQRIQSWSFPKPRGGGVVSVRYPFLLKPGN